MHVDQKGFSLIELLVVVGIIGILAGIAIPTYMGIQKKAMRSEFKTNLEVLRLLEEKYHSERGVYIAGASTLDLMGVLTEFKPADPARLDTLLRYDYNVTTAQNGQVFIARAIGKANGPDSGLKFCMNQDNEKQPENDCLEW